MNQIAVEELELLRKRSELLELFATSVPVLKMAWRLNDKVRLRRALETQSELLEDYEKLRRTWRNPRADAAGCAVPRPRPARRPAPGSCS